VNKNHELVTAFREKSKIHQQLQKAYQTLKAQVMASQVQTAASDDAEHTLRTAGAERFVDRLGTGGGIARYPTGRREVERIHSRQKSGGSINSADRQRSGGPWNEKRYDNRGFATR